MNIERFDTFAEEYFNCRIKSRKLVQSEDYNFYCIVLENGIQFVIKEPREKEE